MFIYIWYLLRKYELSSLYIRIKNREEPRIKNQVIYLAIMITTNSLYIIYTIVASGREITPVA